MIGDGPKRGRRVVSCGREPSIQPGIVKEADKSGSVLAGVAGRVRQRTRGKREYWKKGKKRRGHQDRRSTINEYLSEVTDEL